MGEWVVCGCGCVRARQAGCMYEYITPIYVHMSTVNYSTTPVLRSALGMKRFDRN